MVALQNINQLDAKTYRFGKTYHIKVEVGDLALAVASKCQTVGKRADTVFSSVECLLSVMWEGGFGVLNRRKSSVTSTSPFASTTYRNNHFGNRQSVEQGSGTIGAVIISDVGQDHALPASKHVSTRS